MRQLVFIVSVCFFSVFSSAGNIDLDNAGFKYAWGSNVGWINFGRSDVNSENALVTKWDVTGYIWAENIGWINLSPEDYAGIENDGNGNLSGFAWGENVGWINFNPKVPNDPADYGVKIDASGNMSGWAWGENIGWINFNTAYTPQVCIVETADLLELADNWLSTKIGIWADLNASGSVDKQDFSIMAEVWQDYCPRDWK